MFTVYLPFYAAMMLAQAIFLPELPDGCVAKSSAFSCMIIVLPIISSTLNRSVMNIESAKPLLFISGGKSPA